MSTVKKTGFKPVSPKISFPELEEEILKYWKENRIFERSIEERPLDKPWTFLDGPPFVTGMPHYGHLLGSIHKDIFGRYWTMKGYRVPRVWGWDGHGLPIENKVEGKLDIKSKKDIEQKVGIKTFIDACKEYVEEISGEWEWYVDHIGRWVDFKNAYKTWDLNYMESVMWVFKQMYTNGHVYKGLKVTLYCPHCATPISNFEVAMDADNYKEIPDAATTYKYQLRDEPDTFILAWSTTPWNKIVTPALAVNPELVYVKVQQGEEKYILAKSTIKVLDGKEDYTLLDEMTGADLVGLKFVPHYDYYPINEGEKAFEVISGDFVTAEEGTGVVTIAAYGEEDLTVMQRDNVHIELHVDDEGMIKPDVPKFGGMYYLKANKAVNQDLSDRGLIYDDKEVLHKVPLCWRCHTRLYYAPINAWYVNIQKLKPLLLQTNEEVNWFPKHFKEGRFKKSIENAPDWNISRNRYWGSPVPVWECSCGEVYVPGSVNELEKASGRTITDLHKPDIDEVTVTCNKCQKIMKRVPEVLDSWIEAGSASFAERHFPFNKEAKLEDFFPPDFIAEYTGQIRAWFYVMHVIGAALYESKAFKNVGVEGVILGTDGRKMSKNLKNYPDPKELLEVYGGDALRLYLMSSPVMHGEDMIISEEHYRNQVRGMMLILWNVYNFFITYSLADNWNKNDCNPYTDSNNILDKWILSLLHKLIKECTNELEKYDTVAAINKLQKFVDEFSTWYIRRSRDRVGPSAQSEEDKEAFYATTFEVLVKLSTLLAPITPFLSESIYMNVTGEASVHLAEWPKADESIDLELIQKMELAKELANIGHAKRKAEGWGVKEPKKELAITASGDYTLIKDDKEIMDLILSELNAYALKVNSKFDYYHKNYNAITPEWLKESEETRRIIRQIQGERKNLAMTVSDKVDVTLPNWPKNFEEEITVKTNIRNLTKGESFEVKKVV